MGQEDLPKLPESLPSGIDFEERIESLISNSGKGPISEGTGNTRYSVPLHLPDGGEDELIVVKEDILRSWRGTPCDYCRVLDWCYQPQTGFRYHLILAADQAFDELPWPGKDKRYCRACAGLVSASVQRCPYCGLQIGRRPRTVEKTTHRIHALFHANGNGHLLRVNGFEAGSKRYSGGQLVNLFHSLCGDLRTTSTSVEDVSEKSGVRFAPLHAVAFGSTWYGKFGYEFATGCFGATEQDYHQALSRLRQAGIEAALADASVLPNACSLRRIRAEYCPNGSTLSDLFSALLSSRSSAAREAVKAQQIQCDSGATKEVSARAHGNCGDASATPTKRKSKDPLSNGLHMGGDTDPHDKLEKVTKDLIEASSSFLSEYAPASRVNRGALHLSDLPRCVEVVRDTKHFVKRFLNPDDDMRELAEQMAVENHRQVNLEFLDRIVCVWCQARDGLNVPKFFVEKKRRFQVEGPGISEPPPCLVEVSARDNFSVLLGKLQRRLQQRYPCLKDCKCLDVCDFPKYPNIHTKLTGRHLYKLKRPLLVRVHGIDETPPMRFITNPEWWEVRCSCGCMKDDGERMAQCDKCKFWAHTRCSGIEDKDQVGRKFLCALCQRGDSS